MLAPTRPQLCLLLSKATIEASLHMLGLQVIFLFVPSLLPTVMDPSSVIIRLLFFFFLFLFLYFYNSYRHANLDLPHVADSRLISSFPLLVYNKALREGFNVCEHHKCFILPMHRLGCLERETVVFCAGTRLCNISHEFLCLPHCCRFLQRPLTSQVGGMRNHCTDCCEKNE